MARASRALIAITLPVLLLGIAHLVDPVGRGALATCFADTNWSGAIARSSPVAPLSAAGVWAAWRGQPPPRFSMTWSGSLIAPGDGTYSFAAVADGPARLFVDRQLVVDNRGGLSQPATGTMTLARGVHAVFAQYAHTGEAIVFELQWDRGGRLEPLPAWAVTPRAPSFGRFLASVLLTRALPWAIGAWAIVLASIAVASAAPAVRRYLAAPAAPPAGVALLLGGIAILFFVLPHEIQSDGRARFYALVGWLEWGDLSPIPYSLVGPLASVPLYFLGRIVMTPEWWCARFNTIVLIAGLAAFHRLLRDRIETTVVVRFLLLLAAASMFPYHVEGYFGEVFTAVLVAVGLLAVSTGHPIGGWAAIVAGVANTPATLAAMAPAAAWHAWRTRRARHLLPVVVAAAAIMAESWLRRGSPFLSGYENNSGAATVLTYSGRPGFSYPLLFGVLSVLFSFGKGLFFFAPGLVYAVRERLRGADGGVRHAFHLWMIFLAGLVLVYSKWWAWYGGLFWGPRFFLFASIPASLAIAVRLAEVERSRAARAVALLSVLILSSWVAIDGAVFDLSGLAQCRDPAYEFLCFYVPEFSPLWRPFVEFTHPSFERVVVGAYFAAAGVWLAVPVARAAVAAARTRPSTAAARDAAIAKTEKT
jgi:PA14 domain-containing protein